MRLLGSRVQGFRVLGLSPSLDFRVLESTLNPIKKNP